MLFIRKPRLPAGIGPVLSFFLLCFVFLLTAAIILNPVQASDDFSALVVVEDYQEARPQAGLADADLVYEFLVEGGITRFIVGYTSDFPDKIGPIRSLRSYMVEASLQHDSILFHAGASEKALHRLYSGEIINMDELQNDSYFFRHEERSVPHNIYTGDNYIREAGDRILNSQQSEMTEYEYNSNLRDEIGIDFYEEAKNSLRDVSEPAKEVVLSFWGRKISYILDQENEKFKRYYGDNPHRDVQGKIIAPKNLVIMRAEHSLIDDEGRLDIDLKSAGEAIFLSGGQSYKGSWEYSEDNEKIEFKNKDDDSDKIILPEGFTWINIIPETADIKIE